MLNVIALTFRRFNKSESWLIFQLTKVILIATIFEKNIDSAMSQRNLCEVKLQLTQSRLSTYAMLVIKITYFYLNN